ncbi:MAG: putative nucleotidyltransferase substrate binding domain-containing protein [Thermodesulfobacteriota bacterium]
MGGILKRHAVVPREFFDFLSKTLPFTELDKQTLEHLASRCSIEFYPKGTVIFRQYVTDVAHFHLIHKGGVKFYLSSDETLVTLRDYGGEGESFGALSIVRGEKADFHVEAIEDTFCILIDKDTFLEVFREHDRFAQHYLSGFSEDVMGAIYSELRYDTMGQRGEQTYHLFDTQLRSVLKGPPVFIEERATVQQAGARMSEIGAEALLVRDQSGSVKGIVVDSDLRTRVVAEGLDYRTPVGAIMSSPLVTIPAQALCFDALLKMMRERVGHLVVEHRKTIIGVLSSQDIVIYQGASPVLLFREIQSQRSIKELRDHSKKIPIVMRTLLEEGARGGHICRIVTIFHDSILKGLLSHAQEETGPPPMPFCWLMLGGAGRMEEAFALNRQIALIHSDAEPRRGTRICEYYRTLSDEAVSRMRACGYPVSDEHITPSNPRWCQPWSVWINYFDDWLRRPDPNKIAACKVFLDFRPLFGDCSIGERLRDHVTSAAMRQPIFLRLLANDCLSRWPRVSFFRDRVVEDDGEQSKRLDLKIRGLTPFIDFARLMALKHGIGETGTIDRLRRLDEQGCVPQDLCAETREAFEFHVQLALVNQLKMVEAGMRPDSYIQPSTLTDRERRTLKDAFAVIDRMMAYVKQVFGG